LLEYLQSSNLFEKYCSGIYNMLWERSSLSIKHICIVKRRELKEPTHKTPLESQGGEAARSGPFPRQGGGGQMRTSVHFGAKKNPEFSKFMVCPHGQVGFDPMQKF